MVLAQGSIVSFFGKKTVRVGERDGCVSPTKKLKTDCGARIVLPPSDGGNTPTSEDTTPSANTKVKLEASDGGNTPTSEDTTPSVNTKVKLEASNNDKIVCENAKNSEKKTATKPKTKTGFLTNEQLLSLTKAAPLPSSSELCYPSQLLSVAVFLQTFSNVIDHQPLSFVELVDVLKSECVRHSTVEKLHMSLLAALAVDAAEHLDVDTTSRKKNEKKTSLLNELSWPEVLRQHLIKKSLPPRQASIDYEFPASMFVQPQEETSAFITSKQVRDVINALESGYEQLKFEHRVLALACLCEDMNATRPIREYLDELLEAVAEIKRERFAEEAEKRRRKKEEAAAASGLPADAAAADGSPTTAAARAQEFVDALPKTQRQKEAEIARAAKAKEQQELNKRKRDEKNERFIETTGIAQRICPVGTDRYQNTYWVFPDQLSTGIFVENVSHQWTVFDSAVQIVALLSFLHTKSLEESQLKAKLTLLRPQIVAKLPRDDVAESVAESPKEVSPAAEEVTEARRSSRVPKPREIINTEVDTPSPKPKPTTKVEGVAKLTPFEQLRQLVVEFEDRIPNCVHMAHKQAFEAARRKWNKDIEAASEYHHFSTPLLAMEENLTQFVAKAWEVDHSTIWRLELSSTPPPPLARFAYLASLFFHACLFENDVPNAAKRCRVCANAKDAEKTLLCDGCNDAYHMYCLTPPLKNIPAGEWLCLPCREGTRFDDGSEDLCSVCKKTGDLLCCDTCPQVYHLGCLDPPLKKVPKGDWLGPCCNPIERRPQRSTRSRPSS